MYLQAYEVYIEEQWSVAEVKSHLANLSRKEDSLGAQLYPWTEWPKLPNDAVMLLTTLSTI